MKTFNDEELNAIVNAIGGDTPSSTATLPQAGIPLTIKDMKPQAGIPQRDANGALTGETSNPWVRVEFNEGGILSLNGILRSPDIKWEGLNTNKDRIKALCAGQLVFTHQEEKTSRANTPYKLNHFVPQTFKAEVGETPKKK